MRTANAAPSDRPTFVVVLRPLPNSPVWDAGQLKHDLKAYRRDRRLMLECVDVIEAPASAQENLRKPNVPKTGSSFLCAAEMVPDTLIARRNISIPRKPAITSNVAGGAK